MTDPTIERRFWAKVRKGGQEECWQWIGAITDFGYGKVYFCGRLEYSHRVSFILHKGPIPNAPRSGYHGTVIMHTCDNPACVNPAHLVAATQADNIRDAMRKGRSILGAGESHPSARLSASEVRAIRADKRPHARVAKDYGVSYGMIWNIRTGRAWRSVA